MKIEILNDVLFICQRLKEIDKDYRVFYNTKTNKFEVHNVGQIGDSYCLTVPFQYLDARTIDFVNKTKVENKEKLIKEMDKENEILEERNNKRILYEAKDRLLEEIKYSKI